MEKEPRRIRPDELEKLIDLYRYLHPGAAEATESDLKNTWQVIIENPEKYIYLVIEDGDHFISSCNISIIPNLTHGLKPFALIENVITHPDYRKQGLAQKILNAAIEIAKNNGCYKVMLLSNAERIEAHKLYEKLGFSDKLKKGYLKIIG